MATIQERPFSKDYSGLINQSVVAVGILVIAISSHEYMRRKRRGDRWNKAEGLGSVESWQFGYLFQGRSWARKPSPPLPDGWSLSWVKQALVFPLDQFNELRGVDASLYIRFLHGCFWFTLSQMLTTLPILFPIHLEFSETTVSKKSMTRASISSLAATQKGLSLLWIHLLLLIWITLSWMFTLFWITKGAFMFRAQKIQEAAEQAAAKANAEKDSQYHPHPHPQYPFYAPQPLYHDKSNRGLRLRTVMVTNIPPNLRSERDLKEYFEYYLSRHISKPALGVTTTTQPGFLNRTFAFLFNKAKHIPNKLQKLSPPPSEDGHVLPEPKLKLEAPMIDKVVLVRKMSDLASLLERREEVLRLLETAHIKLARRTLGAVKEAMKEKPPGILRSTASRVSTALSHHRSIPNQMDEEAYAQGEEAEGEDRMHLLIRVLSPYLDDNLTMHRRSLSSRLSKWRQFEKCEPDVEMSSPVSQDATRLRPEKTVWEALLSLPRSTLDTYQPLIHLNSLFRGKTVPSIDYYTAKLNLLTALITEKRAKAISEYTPMATAFVTFQDPADARRACRYLAVHPNNPLNACLVSMAPSYEDLDWTRLMKSTFRVEFVKDWVVNLGVWGFTIFWVFPVSFFVTLVSIQNISAFWPGLKKYLDKHEWEEELIQSLLPTVLVALLALLIPMILLLIAKKAHTISTLSLLHDRIMTRYYKFLIVNVLVFFCVGTLALQSFLISFSKTTGLKVIQVISDSFPTAGPFYVGWLIFTTAMHGGFELSLFGLPLIVYPSTKRQVTPRKRAVGIRPRTFNYYYWLPNHLLVIHVCLVFAVLNPLVIPFGWLYFCVEATVIKNQLLHVYAKNYELNGQHLLIRLIRYSLDGLILAQSVFLAYMVVLKKTPNVAVSAVLVILTAFFKMILTRIVRARHERDDIIEADIVCGKTTGPECTEECTEELVDRQITDGENRRRPKGWMDSLSVKADFWTMKLASRMRFSYSTVPNRPRRNVRRHPNPFGPRSSDDSIAPIQAAESSSAGLLEGVAAEPTSTPPQVTAHPTPIETPAEPRPVPLVSPHPPHPRWDDESSFDQPYDNPFYTRTITDVLWLPRDPLGLLDLDDTIDLRVSITSEPGAGKLGNFVTEDDLAVSSLSSVLANTFDGGDDDNSSYSPVLRYLDGNEDINLPEGIASRVGNLTQEPEVESTRTISRRPTMLGKRTTSSESITSSEIHFRRPSTFNAPSSVGFRSFSLGSETTTGARRPALSGLSSSDRRRKNRAASMDTASMIPARTVSQASRSVLSLVETPSSLAPPRRPQGRTASMVSTREAVVGEVIEEEREAHQEQKRQAEAEEERAKEPRSFWTSWLFTRGPQ
ncbi:CSC1 family protein [Abortiporus biennis]